MGMHSVSKGEMTRDIRRVARVLGHSPSSVEYIRLGQFHIRTLEKKFKLGWKQIIANAGLRYTPRTSHRIPTTQELRNDLLRVAHELDHAPTRAEYQARGKFDSETIRRRSGEKRWEDALVLLAGFNREEIKFHQARGGVYRTTDEWLSKLKRLSIELGHAPTTAESNAAGINAHQLCLRLQGNWTDVLKAAEANLRKRSGHAKILSTTTETLIEDVIAVTRRLGRPPKAREYALYGHYPYTAIRGRMGGWKKVKKIAQVRTGIDLVGPPIRSFARSSHSMLIADHGAQHSRRQRMTTHRL